jgi:hypothetical protein
MTTISITPSANARQIFAHLTARHACLHNELRANKLAWRNLPDGECRREVEIEIARTSWTMLELRDAGRVALGINSGDDGGNPFGGSDDFREG